MQMLEFGQLQVPVLILIVLFLTAFGLLGLGIQSMAVDIFFGGLLPISVVTLIAFIVSLPLVRIVGGVLAKVMPKDETETVTYLYCHSQKAGKDQACHSVLFQFRVDQLRHLKEKHQSSRQWEFRVCGDSPQELKQKVYGLTGSCNAARTRCG